MKQRRIYAYLLCGLSVMNIHGALAQAGSGCDKRAGRLNEKFGAKYIELDAKCYGAAGGAEPQVSTTEVNAGVTGATSENSLAPIHESCFPRPDGSLAPIHESCFPKPESAPPPINEGCQPPVLSAECQAEYTELAEEAAKAWDDLYKDCPDLARPIPVAGGAGGDKPTFRDGVSNVAGPSFKAPTKVELLKRVKSLEKNLRRATASRRKGPQSCRK